MIKLSIKTIFMVIMVTSILIAISTQYSFASTQILDLSINSDGSTNVVSQTDVDPSEHIVEIELVGTPIGDFEVSDEKGPILSNHVINNKVVVSTVGSSKITVNYNVNDLIKNEEKIWTFSFDSPLDYTLTFPKDSTVVGINAPVRYIDGSTDTQTKLKMSRGSSEINYFLGPRIPFVDDPPVNISTGEADFRLEYSIILILSLSLGSTIAISIRKIRNMDKRADPVHITDRNKKWDVFISHASEDKEKIAKPLAERLQAEGFEVWFDEWQLKIGTNLRRSIEDGLGKSYFGIVILSRTFFNKEWTKIELDSLISIMTNSHEHNIFPILYDITHEELATLSPILANIISRSWEDDGEEKIVKELIDTMVERAEQLV